MGGGSWNTTRYTTSAKTKGYDTKSTEEVFSKKLVSDMNPLHVVMREARDSVEHPESYPIIIGLDVTGSMGVVPTQLIRKGLPTIMGRIIEVDNIKDPQLLFMAVGDHFTDDAPLQVGQFESSDELLQKWLESTYPEGGGGGNGGESYFLPWYFAAFHTATDSFEKRGEKGVLITIGDESIHKGISKNNLKQICSAGENQKEFSCAELLEEARKKWHVHHIHARITGQGKNEVNINNWKELIGDDLVMVDSVDEVPVAIANIIARHKTGATAAAVEKKEVKEVKPEPPVEVVKPVLDDDGLDL